MNTGHAEYSMLIQASPATVYGILTDYEVAHPAILPKQYFKEIVVTQGGQGAGTEFQLEMEVFGVKRSYAMTVSEPEPGYMLVETDSTAGTTTYFVVEPVANPQECRVTIKSDATLSKGIAGWFEKMTYVPLSKHIYKQELQLLNEYAQNVAEPSAT